MLMDQVHAILFRVWIALAIAVDIAAIVSLFTSEGSSWAIARKFVLLLTFPAIFAGMWLHKRRKLVASSS
jgi:hypothetical protein